MKWTEVRVDTVSKNEDVVSAVLYDMGATGLVVEDPNDILEKIQDPKSDYIVADEFFKNPEEVDKEKIVIKAYFPETPIIVYENACAGVTPDKHQAAIETMKSCQIDVQTYL